MLETVKRDQDVYTDQFAQFSQAVERAEPAWLSAMRKTAIARFADLGFPSTRHEDWKYTNIRSLVSAEFRLSESSPQLTEERLSSVAFTDLGCPRIVFEDGKFAPQLSELAALPEGLRVLRLSEALQAEGKLIERHLGQYAAFENQAFSALNTAFLSDGAFIHVAPGKVIEQPIQVLFVSTGQAADSVSHPRNLFLIEENSQARIIETYASLDETRHLTNSVTEVVLGANAVVDHVKLQNESRSCFHVGRTQVLQERSSTYTNHNLALGSGLARNDIATVLDGEGGLCYLNGLFAADGSQHVDNFTIMEHVKPNCDSWELYKGVLDDKARGVFHGRIIVHPDAQKTDSKQTNDNLLISDNALVNTKPQLEIYADDVKCTHGATIGQLEKEALFYLRSRGIEAEAARSLLIYAFASEIVNRIVHQPLRDQLHGYLADWLPNGHLVKEAD